MKTILTTLPLLCLANDMMAQVSGTATPVTGVRLEADTSLVISDVIVSSSLGLQRKTPIAFSNVTSSYIENISGNKEFPEVLKMTPGIYASKLNGGYGDSKLNMRGFQSANVAVMVNGVPVNDMEWGGVYWSNWSGLGEVTRYIQTQRGMGASKVSVPSVGGTVNVVTKTIDAERGGSFTYGVGNDGYNELSLVLLTGLMKHDWAVTALFGTKWGDGYVQGTDFRSYNYFLSIAKRLGERHLLSLTAFGSPQWHNQRSQYDGLTIQGWQDVGRYMGSKSAYRYNPVHGYDKDGNKRSSAKNSYHKPQISLNHQWQIDSKSSLSTALYMSIGRGYGHSGQSTHWQYSWYGASNGNLTTAYRNDDGTFAYDQIQELNAQSTDGSKMVMTESVNNHFWYGLISTYHRTLGKAFVFDGGVDFRSYKGVHYNEINDLYGGEYYVDSRYRGNVTKYADASVNDAWVNERLGVGSIVNRDFDSHIDQCGLFAQVEYNPSDRVSAFVAGTLSDHRYYRYDRYYSDEAHARSENAYFKGASAKGGVNVNISDYHNVYANVGYISRAPFFSGGVFLQAQTSNAINTNALNEKAVSLELGYGWRNSWLRANVNAYYTLWKDKTTTRSGAIGNTDLYVMNMSGVDALHKGLEMDVEVRPASWITLNGTMSLGNWKWNSNSTAYFYNSASQPLADISTGEVASAVGADDHQRFTLNQKGKHVGGSPQTTMTLGADFRPLPRLLVGAQYIYYARNFSDFTLPTSPRGNEFDLQDPWQMPSAMQVDLHARYDFPKIYGMRASVIGNVENLFDYEYITDAFYDGLKNTQDDVYRVFYSFGRTFSVKLKVTF